MKHTHSGDEETPKDCTLCLLHDAALATCTPSSVCGVLNWRSYLQSKGMDFNLQQDVGEGLQLLCSSGGFESIAVMHAAVTGSRKTQATYACGHMPPIGFSTDFSEVVIELLAGTQACSVSELLSSSFAPAALEYKPCYCKSSPEASVSIEIKGASDILMLSISRQAPHARSTKRLTRIATDSNILFAGRSYVLRAVVVHIGSSSTAGHYVTYVRVSDNAYVLYNDNAPCQWFRELPACVEANSRLIFYEDAATVKGRNEVSPFSDAAPSRGFPAPPPSTELDANSSDVSMGVDAEGMEYDSDDAPLSTVASQNARQIWDSHKASEGSKSNAADDVANVSLTIPFCMSGDSSTTPREEGAETNLMQLSSRIKELLNPLQDNFSFQQQGAPPADEPENAAETPGRLRTTSSKDAQILVTPYKSDKAESICAADIKAAGATSTDAEARSTMVEGAPERLQADVDELLDIYRRGGDCFAFLLSLPSYIQETRSVPVTPETAHIALEKSVRDMLRENVNATAAFETRTFHGDCMYYPLHVLLQATCSVTGWTLTFTIDCVFSILSSMLNKNLAVKLAQYLCRHRYWSNGVAPAGGGKSPGMKAFEKIAAEVLAENPTLAVGRANDTFHFMQSSTTAAAIDKLRSCSAYLMMWSTDAGRCLSNKFANGGETDPGKHIDLSFFLDAAHGDEFSHQTMETRRRLGKVRDVNPAQPVAEAQQIMLDPTNVTVMWLIQLKIFASYWCQLARNMPIGLVQRILFAFGSQRKQRQDLQLLDFFNDVTAPAIKGLFAGVLGHLGPRSTEGAELLFTLSAAQQRGVTELEETLHVFTMPGSGTSDTMASSMPKALYWTGCSIMLNHVIEAVFPVVLLNGSQAPTLAQHQELHSFPRNVSDGAFLAGTFFAVKRYLFGQCVLDISVKENLPANIVLLEQPVEDHRTPMLLTALRNTPGCVLNRATVLDALIALRRQIDCGTEAQKLQAEDCLQHLLQQLALLGVGTVVRDEFTGIVIAVRKYTRNTLTDAAKEWLRRHRVSLALFGPREGLRTFLPPSVFASRDGRGTNLSLTIPSSGAALQPQARTTVTPERDFSAAYGAADADTPVSATAMQKNPQAPLRPMAKRAFRESKSARATQNVGAIASPTVAPAVVEEPTSAADMLSHDGERSLSQRPKTRDNWRVLTGAVVLGVALNESNLFAHVKALKELRALNPLYVYVRSYKKFISCFCKCSYKGCTVEWLARYYTRPDGTFKAGTLLIQERNAHAHADGLDSGRIWPPGGLEHARSFLDGVPNWRTINLKDVQAHIASNTDKYPTSPTVPQIQNWLKREKKARARTQQDAQPGSLSLVQPLSAVLETWQGDVAASDASITQLFIPTHPQFALVLDDRLCVPFLCRGMYIDILRYVAPRLHLVADVKVDAVADARGVATLAILTKSDHLRVTDLYSARGSGAGRHIFGRRVQGKANTTVARPALNAVVGGEDKQIYLHLIRYFKHLWEQAHPDQPLSSVLKSLAKDFVPGLEAARREELPFCRPLDDFWHLISKPKELGKKCKVRASLGNASKSDTALSNIVAAAGTSATLPMPKKKARKETKASSTATSFYLVHFDRITANLHAFHTMPTPDLVALLWPAFLRRCIADDELVVADWLRKQYSDYVQANVVRTMGLCTFRPHEKMMFFLSWNAGFFTNPPGMLGGSNSGEALNSNLDAALKAQGRRVHVAESMPAMQSVYQNNWQMSMAWTESTAETLTYERRPHDQTLVNSSKLPLLGRTTAFDFHTASAEEAKHALVYVGSHVVLVMPRKASAPLPEQSIYESGARMLYACDNDLEGMLIEAGVLRRATDVEAARLAEVDATKYKTLSTQLQLPFADSPYVLSLSVYNTYFEEVVYILLTTPACIGDGWLGMRCSCHVNGIYGDCEHTYFARTAMCSYFLWINWSSFGFSP